MGQYWYPVNLTKREFVHPHKLGDGLKLKEQLYNNGVGRALVILTAAMPAPRGGGDLNLDPIIGSWAGDRIAIVGDYAKDSDLKDSPVPASSIAGLCEGGKWKDVTDDVCRVIEKELNGKFIGDGWRDFVSNNE